MSCINRLFLPSAPLTLCLDVPQIFGINEMHLIIALFVDGRSHLLPWPL